MSPRRLMTVVTAAVVALSPLVVQAAEIETARGPVEVATPLAKVAVFDMAALDTLQALGVQPAGLPEKLYLPQLEPLLDGAEVVGNLFEPDLEALSALEPDLIILGGRSSTKVDATSQVAPTIDMTMTGQDLVQQAKQRLAAYATLFGKEEAAAKAASELDEQIEATRAATAGKGTALIVMTNGPKITAYGASSRFGWVHSTLDLPPAVSNLEAANHGEAVSFEFIAKANPDWLLVLDRAEAIGSGDQGAEATLNNELVAQTSAWKKGQVVYLPAADFYIAAGGIQSTKRVLAAIAEAFSRAQ
ncbi:Periplasmic binding protein precursor (plasmid) [Pseudorhizobium banfieldiae]|uniref:Periplasmic binding protein n=2 Tax=Pseudorhizobium TaxID=1903858 RepID=L0NMS5_9HYPH|nr:MULTISPECIES: siderophore ABC transporter substrate-binding protein [Pseudorhizobium]CAD6628631.1 iron ABC transporter substrate-binding protein [arsenite-oxidising bacterium NT-25]CAD7054231.1 iron ABC transporter substrate-binding protein [Pseudorhizobium halotolerans]CCF22169.1 Periplasmic binding protein precursor [Pseudorhizobium banfieldiae]